MLPMTKTRRLLAILALACVLPPAGAAHAASPGYHVVDRIPLSDGWWDYASFDAVHRRLFVARGNGVYKLDVDSGLMDMRVVPGSEGRAVVPLPIGDLVLTTMAGYSCAILFSGEDGKVAKLFELRQAADAALWEPAGHLVWAMGGHGEIALLDPVRLEQVGSVDLGEPLEATTTDGRGRVYVNGARSATVIAVDAASRKVVGRWPMPGCEDPSGLAYVDGADVVLSVCANSRLEVLDGRSGAVLGTLAVGAGADAVIYDAGTQRAFVPSAIDGLLTVVAVRGHRDFEVLEQVPTQVGTRTGAIDPKTGTLYLPTARFGPLNKLGWPEALPGTVQLLVMRPQP
jgi:DNA-binding beta-propeller fold protein YncE